MHNSVVTQLCHWTEPPPFNTKEQYGRQTNLTYWAPDWRWTWLRLQSWRRTAATSAGECIVSLRWTGPCSKQTRQNCSERHNVHVNHKQCTLQLSCYQTAHAINEKVWNVNAESLKLITKKHIYITKLRYLTEGSMTIRNEELHNTQY